MATDGTSVKEPIDLGDLDAALVHELGQISAVSRRIGELQKQLAKSSSDMPLE